MTTLRRNVLRTACCVFRELSSPVVALARPFLVRWLGTAGRLAADNLGRNKLRAVLTAGALTAALTTIIATSGLMTATFKGGLGTYFGFFNEDGMLMPDIAALFASGELSLENSYEKLTTGAALDPALVQAVESLTESGLFGEDVDAAIAQVQSAIEPFEGVSVGKMTPEALEATWFKIFDQVQMLLNALLLLAVIVAALGVVNTVVINVAERRRWTWSRPRAASGWRSSGRLHPGGWPSARRAAAR
jgi:hypothetical protein